VVGLGTADIGGGSIYGWAPRDENESVATVRRALELGINWLDTAPAYGDGRAEEIVRRALAGGREGVIIATKCSVRTHCAKFPPCSIAEGIRCQLEASLRRLDLETIDLYQIHWPASDIAETEEAWSAVADLVRAGKVRYGGVSNFSLEQLERAQAIHPVASLQPPYSMLTRDAERLLPYCAAHGIGVISYSPMQSGILTGRFTREYVVGLPQTDWRLTGPHFHEPRLSANLALVERLRTLAERSGRTVAELAIAWVLRRLEVAAAIVGARRPSQIEETASAGDWTLSPEEIAEVEDLLAGAAAVSRDA
jgi:aryl-alcohol dehydrogenase-like predicted oxidoreductase